MMYVPVGRANPIIFLNFNTNARLTCRSPNVRTCGATTWNKLTQYYRVGEKPQVNFLEMLSEGQLPRNAQ